MTVNTLGSDSRIGGGSVATSKSPESRTVAEWLWPLLVGGAALFAISALVYYNIHPKLEVTSFLQHTIAKIYNWFGFAPSVVFFLMVFAWSSIWAVTGILERPLARFGRLLVMALMVGVFLNLGSGGVSSGAHTGAIGAWIASRLVVGIGYVFSIVLVGPAMFASLMLATDWFFSEWFERDRKTTNFETGVEVGVTDHLRSLSEVANRPVAEPAADSQATTAGATSSVDVTVDDDVAAGPAGGEGVDQAEIAAQLARVAAAAIEEPTVVLEPAATAPETAATEAVPANETGGDEGAADDHVIVPARPLSYAERRRQRAERRVREEEPEPTPVPAPVASNADSEGVDDTSTPAGSGAVMVTEEELESLFDADGADAEAVAEEPVVEESEVDEVADEAPVAEASVAEVDVEDVDETEEEEAADDVDGEEEFEEEEEEEEELEDDEEVDEEVDEDEEELEDDEEVDEDDLEDDEEVDEDELEDDEEEELEDEEEVDEDELEDDEEVDEEELEDDEEVDEDELEDDEDEDEDEDEEEEEEEEFEEDDEESAELEEESEEEVFVTADDVEADEEHVIDEAVEATLVDDLAASVADVDEESVDAEAAEQQYTEPEEIVSIPRPEEAPAVSLPTPPEVREPEESPASRQQKLFSSEIDEELMEEAVDLVNSGRRTTATLLQRKLRIDYELAVEVLSELTTRGLVSGDDDLS